MYKAVRLERNVYTQNKHQTQRGIIQSRDNCS